MATENWFDQQRASLRLLQTHVRERAAGEKALTDGFSAAVDAAEKEVAKSRRVLGAAKARALGEQAAERTTAEAQLQSALGDVERTAATGYQETKIRTEQSHRAAEAEIRTRRRNAIGRSTRSTRPARNKRRN